MLPPKFTLIWIGLSALLLVPRLASAPSGSTWSEQLAAARILYDNGKFEQASKALASAVQQVSASGHPPAGLAEAFGEIGALYFDLGMFNQASTHLRKSLRLWEKHGDPSHPGRLRILNKLVSLYIETGQVSYAQELAEKAVSTLSPTPDALHNLASIYYLQGRYKDAESLFRQTMTLLEQDQQADDTQMMYVLVSMATVLVRTSHAEQALDYLHRARRIGENILGSGHIVLARGLIVESRAYRALKLAAQATAAIETALASIPSDVQPLRQAALDEYAQVLRQAGRAREARKVATEAAEIRANLNLGGRHTVDVNALKNR